MKGGIALLLLVVVAGLAESKPSPDLRARVQARVEEIVARKVKGDGDGKMGGKGGKGGEEGAEGKGGKGGKGDKDIDWPYGWIEYSSLVGKCVAALNWLELFEMDPPSEGVLAEACPKAFEGGEKLLEASEDELKEATKFMREIFPLLQCVNLQAEREEVHVSLFLTNKTAEEDVYLRETAPLFAVCDTLFESVEAEIEELEKDVDEMEEIEEEVKEEERTAQIKALLRELIHTAAKRR